MKLLHYSIIVTLILVLIFTFYVENSHDAHATCVTINGTEECSPLPPVLTSIKSHYIPNETIHLVGFFRPNTMMQIDLVDPNNNVKNSVLFQSDSSGNFQNKLVVPNDAVNGTWKINASSGLTHSTSYITVISKNLQQNQSDQNGIIPACCLLQGLNSTNILQSPLKQFKSEISAKDITCKEGLQLIIKAEDGSPACVKPDTAQILLERGWAKQELYVDHHMSPKVTLSDYFYDGIDKDGTTVSINNQTYYQTTLNYTVDNLRKDASIQFHGVTFTFPEGILDTPGGSMTILDVKFPDGYEETYGRKMMNQDGSGSGIGIPSKFGPPARTSITVLSNHVMPQAGLTIYHDKLKLLVSIGPINMLSENCGQFYTVPENKSDFNAIPVLVLKQNSTGCAKLTFTVNSLFNNTNDCMGCNSQMVKIKEMIRIGKYLYTASDSSYGISSLDATRMFEIKSIPDVVDISKYPVGSNFTTVFIIKPLPNATGFYDYSIEKLPCNDYPLAVGYSPDQVNSSDFSKGLRFIQNHPCVSSGLYGLSAVQVSGMDYVQMKLN